MLSAIIEFGFGDPACERRRVGKPLERELAGQSAPVVVHFQICTGRRLTVFVVVGLDASVVPASP